VESRSPSTACVLVWVARISSEDDARAADPGLARKYASEEESCRTEEPEEDGPDGGKILSDYVIESFSHLKTQTFSPMAQ
jgi:hypothetical protein